MTLNPQQAAAARRINQDVCVVAGPGSGKTRVLIERFSWLVTERHISPHRILAITFTEKAATEIKERLVKSFAGHQAVREQIEHAYVSTIHAFCARMLREHSIAAGIDPEFRVLDVSQSIPLLRDVIDEVLEGIYSADPARMRSFLRSLAVGTLRGSFVPDLAGSLEEIYETLRLAGASVDELRQPAPPYDADLARLDEITSSILADTDIRPRTDKQREQHATALDWARSIQSLDWTDIGAQHLSLLCRKNLNSNSLVRDSAAHKHETELRDLTATLRGTLVMHYYAAERELVADALTGIDALYRRRKRESSSVDFDDLEELSIRLLESDEAIRRTIQDSFDYILMDELQDTNPLQWKLISLVRRERNFFAVGDVNQSIYGFRHAQPALFHGYRNGLLEAGLEVDQLRTNYRSRKATLDASNLVFAQAAGVEPHTLEAGSTFCDKEPASVEAIVVVAENAEHGEETEARWVARRIAELVGSIPVADRTARFGDIAILTRANQSTGDLQRALDEFHIPSIVLGGQTFFETREIRDLKLLLDVLVNPCNETSLAGLLRSPMFGVTDEELLRLCTTHGSLSRAVRAEPPAYWDTVAELREVRNLISPERLLSRIIDESDYTRGLTERAQGNIEKFLTTLRDRYARSPRSLAELVDEIDQAAPESEAPPADFGDAVRLMTMHKAKGLEFPIVFLPYLHKGRSNDFPIISYTRENGLGMKWRDPSSTQALSDCVREANKQLQNGTREAEENRLLYVGMTRAMEHLVLSWTAAPRARASWATLVAPLLSMPGVRVLTVDQPPEPLEQARVNAASADVPVIAPAVASALHDSAISVTDVSRFVESPHSYYVQRYLRWEAAPRRFHEIEEADLTADDDRLTASELGTEVHAILSGETVESPSPDSLELVEKFRRSELGKLVAKARRAEHEWDFVMAVGDVVVRGQVDLWFETARDLIIVDYKTDRMQAPIDPDEVRGYELQLRIYAEAIQRATGKRPTRAVLHFLRPDIVHDVDISPLACSSAIEAVHDLSAAQHTLTFAGLQQLTTWSSR